MPLSNPIKADQKSPFCGSFDLRYVLLYIFFYLRFSYHRNVVIILGEDEKIFCHYDEKGLCIFGLIAQFVKKSQTE